MRLGPFEADVLGVLARHPRDAYGLKIAEWLEVKDRRPSSGAVYTTLERLEQKGLVHSSWGEATSARGGRRKRLFTISAKGASALMGVNGTQYKPATHSPIPQGAF
jgi:PadR family transcriptional regulator PadR